MKILALLIGCVLSFGSIAEVAPTLADGRWRIYFNDQFTVVKCGVVLTYTGETFEDQGTTFHSYIVDTNTSNCDYLNVGGQVIVQGGSFNLRKDGYLEGLFYTAGDIFYITNSFVGLDGLTWDGGMGTATGFVGAFSGSKGAIK